MGFRGSRFRVWEGFWAFVGAVGFWIAGCRFSRFSCIFRFIVNFVASMLSGILFSSFVSKVQPSQHVISHSLGPDEVQLNSAGLLIAIILSGESRFEAGGCPRATYTCSLLCSCFPW